DYYSKTLQYQSPEDNKFSKDQAFNAFSFAMYEKITGKESNREKDVRIKSMQSSSAIKMLFTQCPYYMGFFVKSLIQEMDLLVSAGEISEDTYINSLLKEWYENRTFIDRGGDKSKRDESRKVRTITDHTQIRLEYMLENEEVFISIPSIHLGKAQEKSPEIAFYQDSNCIYKDDLKSYGEKFYMVSSKTKIPLKKVLQKPADLFTLEARISYGEKQIYQSKDKLYRTALVFNDLGVEIKKRPDEGEFFYLFTSINAYIDDLLYESPQCNLCYQDDKTQLYRVLMGRDTQVIIDGENLFPIILQDEDLTIKLWNEPIPQIVYNIAGKEYKIFSAQPRIFFDVKDSDKKYMVSIDGEKEPLARYFDKNSKQWEILLPDQSCHELRIYDNSLNKEIFDFFYIVLPKLNIQHEGFYFPLSNEIGTFTLTDENINITKSYSLLPQESSMVIPYLDGELVIDIPRVDCLYNGEQMSSIKSEVMWYEDISQSDTLEIAAPNNLKITFLVGDKSFSCSKIEIGNLIQSINKEEKIIPISCILTSNTKESNITIFKVALRPYFVTTPVKIENGRLTWFPESFIGNRDTNFTLVLRKKRKEIYNQSFSLMDEIIAEGISFEEGVYEAEIYAISPGIFSKKELIGTYRLVVGCHFKFRFEDSLINLTAATIDTKEIPLNEDSGIITDLVYLGKQKLNGEILSYPCYKGCLNWRNNYGDLRPYSSKEGLRVKNNKRINYLAVNPVKVWIINDYTLSLRDQDNDGLYVHKEWRSITDRNYRSKYEEEKYTNPDYYLYKTERIEDV
ncbi:MAG: hypothetical protein QM221_00165, partial [Bacillota bacterium]|nr:hypothetical protein [Bacillota bacterium]